MLYPLVFHPILKERIWGGKKLAELYGRRISAGASIGESWEVSDRPGDVSIVRNGEFAGRDLQWLLQHHGAELMGDTPLQEGRFPLLIKLLDAREKLSLQVHPPAARAAELRGQPKTEMWFIADAEPGAELYVGLRKGVSQREFEERVTSGDVSACFHRIPVKAGDTMFLPSGRVHAIGAGLVIFEIQQNSDTTYRVFDWNRLGLDGKPRELHIQESLQSIDFADFEPSLVKPRVATEGGIEVSELVRDPLFTVLLRSLTAETRWRIPDGEMRVLGLVSGKATVLFNDSEQVLLPGDFCLVPACLSGTKLLALKDSKCLEVTNAHA
jgi:mannose-6-phosphate isomerase